MINATDILTELRAKVAPHLGTTVLAEGIALEKLPIKIEYQGVVGDLEVVSIYFVPQGDDTPAALHIEVEHDHGQVKQPPLIQPDPELDRLLAEEEEILAQQVRQDTGNISTDRNS